MNNTESTSNSIKFVPMPMSALLANLVPLQKNSSSDSSYMSVEDNDNSISESVAEEPSSHHKNIKEKLSISTPITVKNLRTFVSDTKVHKSHNKENANNNSVSNPSFPTKSYVLQSASKNVPQLNTGVKKRDVQNNNSRILDSVVKSTPELVKAPISNQKVKTATPKIKSGIRRFTPGSARRSQKRIQHKLNSENKDSVRCLFPDNKENTSDSHKELSYPKPQPQPIPETPVNRNPIPVSYAATPSYPQGIVGHSSKVLFKTTNIKGKSYMYIKKLGTGGSSEVYKVLEVGTSCEYAVKCVNLATDKELAQGYINEVRLLRELQNSVRVIRLYDYEYDRNSQFLRVVMEVGETDLSSFLKARGACGLPPALVLHYWEEMLHAVHYIHEHGVIHADLKPANFLLVCGRLKLIDFGIASAISGDATSVVRAQAAGTYSYISPEALVGGAGGYGVQPCDGAAPIKISYRSDVWSLGCILYSMVYGRTPFGHIPNLAKLSLILDPNYKIDYPPVEHLPPSLIAALKWCLTYNARARPFVRELLAVPYMHPAREPLPRPLLDKLQPLVTPQEFHLLQRAQI